MKKYLDSCAYDPMNLKFLRIKSAFCIKKSSLQRKIANGLTL